MVYSKLFLQKYKSHWFFILILTVCTVGLVGIASYREYLDEHQKARAETEDLALILEQHTRLTFEKIDLILLHARDLFSLADLNKMDAKKISNLLFQIKKADADVEIMGVADASGNDLGNTGWIKNNGEDFYYEKNVIGDRPYFIKQKNEPAINLVISEPIISRTTGNLIVNISRKLPYKNGKFSGIVFATLNLKSISDFFLKIKQGKSTTTNTISLYTLDKKLLARFPFVKDQIGKYFPNAMTLADRIKLGQIYGHYFKKSAIDNIDRIFAYRAIPEFSMILVVGKAQNTIFASWWSQQGISGVLLVFWIISIIIGLALYLRKLNEAEEQRDIALQATKMSLLGEMAAGIAHEIINPLTIIKLHSTTMLASISTGRIDSDRFKETAQKIDSLCIRIEKIIRGLKSYSRDSSQDPPQPTALSFVVETAIDLTSSRFKNKRVKLTVAHCPSTMIFCREAQISQVLINLLNNASDAVSSLPEKWVELDFKFIDKKIQICITDSGEGIDSEVAGKLMTPFFTTKALNMGTGLGLSISKKIIEEHGGTLRLDQSSKNTCFVIELPAEQL